MQTRTQYILTETAISVVINVALSIGFVCLIFRGQLHVPTIGKHGMVLDMVPQTFMVTLMGSLIPMLLTRSRRQAGVLAWSGSLSGRAINPFLLAMSLAVFMAFLVVTISWMILPRFIPDGIDFHTLVLAKAIFGGLLALAVTLCAITCALRS